ncbi:Mu transposase C-terminal domain-containing protein [Rhizobium rhizogenes]|uniref:Mu transposase C-terminal domain-containing protein n=1 Tax=Rhizobium rhizogenes TaxID=359 RepID=UPI00115E4711|nr:Mu transposase C-terminal domain-containing protein [Rhizobium rhizogenes]NTI88499.1 DDE-type integrase/transposase/recombinase [Rhizobium rhizogenes]TRB25581.1 transposase [Rhizobium rhizogenes]
MLPDIHKPNLFHHAIVKMRHSDRLTDGDVNWRPKKQDAEGWTFSNEGNANDERFMLHGELYTKLVSGAAKIRYGYSAPENQKLRAIFGDDTTINDIVGKRRPLALFREKLIKRFDAEWLALGKKPRWSMEKFEAKLRTWRTEIIAEMLGLDDEETDTRADAMIEVKAFPAPSVKTFRRDYKRYHACGGEVLGIVHRHHGPGMHLRKVDADSVAFAHKQALNYMTDRKPSMAQVYRDYISALTKVNAERATRLLKVTRHKFESIIAKFDEFDKWDGRHGRASALKRFGMVKRGINVLSVGERIEIDFWNVDLMTLFIEAGMWDILPPAYKEAVVGKRIWFVAAIDVATRYILAFRASTNPNAVSAAAAIRMIMSDKQHISDFVGAETPWIGMVQPRDIFSDNGKEFANGLVEGIMRAAKITFNRPQAGNPKARPFIESLFHSIGPLIASYFTGRTFGSIAEKGDYNPEHQMSLQVDEMIQLFMLAICDIYHNKPHSGLGGASPHNAWVRATQEHDIEFPSQDPKHMLHVFGTKFKRRIGQYGIPFMGIPYANEELHRQRTKYGQMEFEIKVDIENLEHIAVRGDKGWFVVENKVDIARNLSLAEWVVARDDLRNQHAIEAEAGLSAMNRTINRLAESGRAAALRANLTPRHLTAEHYDVVDAELFGAWVAVKSANTPAVAQAFALPDDPLRTGSVSNSRLIPDYHAERERNARKKKRATAAENAAVEPIAAVAAEISDNYYEEY